MHQWPGEVSHTQFSLPNVYYMPTNLKSRYNAIKKQYKIAGGVIDRATLKLSAHASAGGLSRN